MKLYPISMDFADYWGCDFFEDGGSMVGTSFWRKIIQSGEIKYFGFQMGEI